jgi:hypothetical protein
MVAQDGLEKAPSTLVAACLGMDNGEVVKQFAPRAADFHELTFEDRLRLVGAPISEEVFSYPQRARYRVAQAIDRIHSIAHVPAFPSLTKCVPAGSHRRRPIPR